MPKVLIVEDDNLVRTLYERLFGFEHYEVLTAANGEEGLKQALDTTPDLILLDIMLPSMDGIEVLRNLKTDDKTKNIPVVMLTNIDDDISLGAAMKLGAADYLVKSNFTPQEIVEKVEKYVSKKTPAETS